jgi:hypothetical protein
MKRGHVVVAVVAAFTACLLVPLAASAARPGDVICPQDTHSFTGTAHDLIVPEGGFCLVAGATITHDLIVLDNAGAEISATSVGQDVVFHDFAGADISDTSVAHDVVAAGTDSGAGITDSTIGHDFLGQGEGSGAEILRTTIGHDMRLLGLGGGTHLESVTIGHDFFASTPQTVQTGHNAPDTPGGPVKVGHDFAIDGSPDFPFVFDGLCNLIVGRDLSITNRTVNLGIGVGALCAGNGQQANTIGRDLIVSGNSAESGVFGPSSIRVGDNRVGRDLVFSHNTAVLGGALEVSGNTVERDATCTANDPAVTVGAPNAAGRSNTCG